MLTLTALIDLLFDSFEAHRILDRAFGGGHMAR